ncbi:MAG TPA: aminoglycoside phosphotransferase [Streptosporangiaceae bacterium]|nr:aminoglycoside phosphotransferase [Streptosporangiaceae bacterium]
MTFEDVLTGWLPGQRWFAGKGTPINSLVIVEDTALVDGDPGLRHLIIAVSQAGGTDRYQLLAGLRTAIPDRLEHAVIGPAGTAGGQGQGWTAYDALHDPPLTQRLLRAMAGQETIGPLSFTAEPDAAIDTSLESLVLTAEQSNTSLLFGEDAILKVFRRPHPGPNPDLEVPRALARAGSPHVAPPLGWVQTTLDGSPTVLAILSAYLRSATDGWLLAATSVRDLYASDAACAAEAGGDFAAEAHRLGEATAEVHRALAETFGTDELPAAAHRELAARMQGRLDSAVAAVPELAPHAPLVSAAFAELARLGEPLAVQRIHGDYHLGQVVRTQAGWVLLDFEGEPAVPLAERRARSPALRDVAGMLRSFDYAARHQLPGQADPGHARAAARDWVCRNQSAFCAGYAEAGGTDPGKHAVLLRALTLDKAVYEVMYEARHRPSWLSIPLDSIADA